MRNIIFRGKRLDNGEWLYGSLLISHFKDDKKERYFITQFSGNYTFEHEVAPATVGQFTGLKDKNGKEIWEGDILSDGAFTYEVRYKGTGFVTILDGYVYTMDTRPTKIVIGNIHDNPDLLK